MSSDAREILSPDVAQSYISPLGEYFSLSNLPTEELPNGIDWSIYGQNHPEQKRWGAALTMHPSVEINSLDSIAEYNRINGTKHTDAEFTKLTPLGETMKLTKEFDLGRSHIIKMEPGGFFTFHRDLDPATFRIIHLVDTSPASFVWINNKRVLSLENKKTYYVNTKLPHAVFAMRECTFIILSCLMSRGNLRKLIHNAGVL